MNHNARERDTNDSSGHEPCKLNSFHRFEMSASSQTDTLASARDLAMWSFMSARLLLVSVDYTCSHQCNCEYSSLYLYLHFCICIYIYTCVTAYNTYVYIYIYMSVCTPMYLHVYTSMQFCASSTSIPTHSVMIPLPYTSTNSASLDIGCLDIAYIFAMSR